MASANFEIFLHKAHRHWSAWLIAEHAGLGLLGGCGCVLLLVPMLLWRGQPGQSVAIVFPSLGATVGAIVGFRRRPCLRDVAQLADDRFNTADLLATALALRGSSEPWHINIVRMADARSVGLSPALLTPHRLSGRAWSGIVLALIAVMTLGMLSITSPLNGAQAGAPAATSDAWRQLERTDAHQFELQQHRATEARAETTPDSQSIQGTDAASLQHAPVEKSGGFPREGQAAMGAGGGSARTDSAHVDMPSNHVRSSPSDSSVNGAIATGGQGSAVHVRADGETTAGKVSPKKGDFVAPWSTSNWPAAQAAAMSAVQDGRVPDAYRNLVRDYFQNPSDAIATSPRQ